MGFLVHPNFFHLCHKYEPQHVDFVGILFAVYSSFDDTVAPPDLLTANKAHANFQGPLQFYPFHLAESQPSGNVPSSPNDVSDDADAIKEGDVKDSSAKVIVRAPSCPEDVPEFVYIR